MINPTARIHRRYRRRGSIYLAVMAYASLMTVIGLSVLLAVRIKWRTAESEIDLRQARLHARSAIELGMWMINDNPNWRTELPNGVWFQDRSIGAGTYTVEGTDPNDADLANSVFHPLVLTGTGVKGAARHKTQVTLEALIKPLGCLEVALHAGDDLNFATALLISDQTISANDVIDSVGSTIDGNVEAVKAINGSGYTGTTTTGIDPRTMPTAAAFNYYLANGTAIAISSMPANANGARLTQVVLSPTSNPFGAETNAEGIYVIDCLGTNLEIKLSRILGTLVLINPGADSIIRQSVNWEPAIANYPALLVRGSMIIQLDAANLDEAALGVNFNPLGTSYDDDEDAVLDDTYPSVIQGLVYVSEDLATLGSSAFKGSLVVGRRLYATGTLDLTYQSAAYDNPPPGFIEVPRMQVVDGSWEQVVD